MCVCDMPSIQHEGLVELVRQHPPLGVELLRHVGIFALPAEVSAVLGSEDMSDVTPRSNGRLTREPKPQKYTADSVVIVADAVSGERLIAVVVEPQGRASDDKDQSWPVSATTARKANKCPRAVLVVACWDPPRRISVAGSSRPATRAWCSSRSSSTETPHPRLRTRALTSFCSTRSFLPRVPARAGRPGGRDG